MNKSRLDSSLGELSREAEEESNTADLNSAAPLPQEVSQWLSERQYVLVQATVPSGIFSAQVWDISAHHVSGEQARFVFKRLAPDSLERQFHLYSTEWLADYAPHVYALLPLQDGDGLLMERFGDTLTAHLGSLSPDKQLTCLTAAVSWLANMHSISRVSVQEHLHTQTLTVYPEANVKRWRTDALVELEHAYYQGLLEREELVDIREKVQVFTEWSLRETRRLDLNSARVTNHLTITHGDCHFGNVLVRKRDFRLIDWEYACVAEPQRDLAGLFQNVWRDDHRQHLYAIFRSELANQGWHFEGKSYDVSFERYFFDNTLMMLGWELGHFRTGRRPSTSTSRQDLEHLVRLKTSWLHSSFDKLFTSQ